MDLQNRNATEREFLPNKHVLIELLTNAEDDSIPLLNFMDNTQFFLEKINTLEEKVQELEQQIHKTPKNPENGNMRKINTYFLPIKVENGKDISIEESNHLENNQEPTIHMENIDHMLMTNLEHMENLVHVAKNLLHK
jgi:hypothetical protein